MSTSTTPNLGMVIPNVLSEPGPLYASEYNAAMTVVDNHDHTANKGLRVPTAGLNINADLPIGNNNVNNARSYRMNNNGIILSGGSDINSIYTFNGNLYFNNSSGTPVKITNASSLNATNTFYTPRVVSANTTILAADVYTYFEINSSGGSVAMTLPSAALVTPGRFYFFKDTLGSAATNNITIVVNGSDTIDGASVITLNRNYQVVSLVCDGASKWQAEYGTPPNFLSNTFGQTGSSTSIIGSTISVQATSTGAVSIGSSGNSVSFNAASYTFGFNSGNTFTSNAATTHIAGGTFTIDATSGSFFNTNVTIGNAGSDVLTVNSQANFNQEMTLNGGHNLTGDANTLVVTDFVQARVTLYATHGAQFGGGASDTIQINGTTIHTQPVNFSGSGLIGSKMTVNDAVVAASSGRFVPRVIFGLGGSATQTFTVASGTVLLKDVSVASGNTTWTLGNTSALTGDIIYVTIRSMKDSTSGGGHFIIQTPGGATLLDITPPPTTAFSPPMSATSGAGQQYQFCFDGTNFARIA